jgi:hypothetical protein
MNNMESMKYKEQIDISYELLKVVNEAIELINKKSIKVKSLGYYKGIILVLFGRCRKQFMACLELTKKGYGEDAGLIIRSMANALIDIKYIDTNRETLSNRYLRYDYIIRKKKLDVLKKWNPEYLKRKQKENNGEMIEEKILREVAEFKKDYPSKNYSDWSGKNMEEKAKAAGNGMSMLYDTSYRYYSDHEHGNVMALSNYIKTNKGQHEILSEPSDRNLNIPITDGFMVFIGIFESFCNAFDFNYGQQIMDLTNKFISKSKGALSKNELLLK